MVFSTVAFVFEVFTSGVRIVSIIVRLGGEVSVIVLRVFL